MLERTDTMALLDVYIQTVPKFNTTYRYTETFSSSSNFRQFEFLIFSKIVCSLFGCKQNLQLTSNTFMEALNSIVNVTYFTRSGIFRSFEYMNKACVCSKYPTLWMIRKARFCNTTSGLSVDW
ncbi:hypothetical protein NQD34_010503 [Periophthalmus magnuspinnatus]|nr:hypothetical protein NQD34_010503 [Periophthalmus magnuspinnatus]